MNSGVNTLKLVDSVVNRSARPHANIICQHLSWKWSYFKAADFMDYTLGMTCPEACTTRYDPLGLDR